MLRLALLLVLVLPVVAGAKDVPDLETPAWWLDQGAEAARKVETPDGKAASLVSVASTWLAAGETTRAAGALAEALSFAEACTGCFGKVQRLVDVALLQREAGAAKAARATLAKASEEADSVKRADAFAVLGGAYLTVGDAKTATALFGKAEALAAKLDVADRVEVLGRIAVAQASAGDGAAVRATMERVRPLVAGQGDPDVEAVVEGVLAALADIAASGGDAKEACRYADGIRFPLARAEALLAVARASDDDGLATAALSRAGTAAKEVQDTPARLLLLGDAADVFAARGKKQEALRLLKVLGKEIGAIDDAAARLEVVLRHAVGLAAAGDETAARSALDAAHEIADEQIRARGRGVALEAIVSAACEAGLLPEAEKTASEIDALRVGVRAYGTLADEQIRRGDKAGVDRTLLWLDAQLDQWPETLERRKDEVLRLVAVIDAKTGRLDAARKRFQGIQSPWHRAAAATTIARALIAAD